MEKNMFENAKFGDKFLTRDGKISIYAGACLNNHHYILIEDETACLSVLPNGSCVNNTFDSPDDIVSKYQEPINEDKLDEFADEFIVTENCLIANTKYRKMNKFEKSIFKAGYYKARE